MVSCGSLLHFTSGIHRYLSGQREFIGPAEVPISFQTQPRTHARQVSTATIASIVSARSVSSALCR